MKREEAERTMQGPPVSQQDLLAFSHTWTDMEPDEVRAVASYARCIFEVNEGMYSAVSMKSRSVPNLVMGQGIARRINCE